MRMESINYTVLVHSEEGSFWAEIEELPGCFASGDTMDELWESLSDSVGAYLSNDGDEVVVKVTDVEPVSQVETVEAKLAVC